MGMLRAAAATRRADRSEPARSGQTVHTNAALGLATAGLTNRTGECPRERRAPASLAGKRVVICDDEGITHMQLRRALARAGLQVVADATNGADGLQAVLRERPDIVLMDVRMPVMDGIEAARRILSAYPVCVVMLTGFANEGYDREARAVGASGYLTKPVSGDALIPVLGEAMDAFARRRRTA